MLSDEEKEALEILKAVGIKCKGICVDEVIINLIEKQSKEIEELKEDRYGLEEEVQIQAKNIMLCENALCEIQDKIKAKIEELEKQDKESKLSHNYLVIPVLQSLLEKE